MFAQITQNARQVGDAKGGQHQRQQIGWNAEQPKGASGQLGPENADQIMNFLVGGHPDGCEVVTIKGDLRHQHQERQCQQRNAENII